MEDELKWMSPRKTWKYIPNRYQALVAQIVAAFLFYNIFEILFQTTRGSNGSCGTLLRPADDGGNLLWFWNAKTWNIDWGIMCPFDSYLLWWELAASIIGLAICGFVLRKAIKRMPSEHREATKNL